MYVVSVQNRALLDERLKDVPVVVLVNVLVPENELFPAREAPPRFDSAPAAVVELVPPAAIGRVPAVKDEEEFE